MQKRKLTLKGNDFSRMRTYVNLTQNIKTVAKKD